MNFLRVQIVWRTAVFQKIVHLFKMYHGAREPRAEINALKEHSTHSIARCTNCAILSPMLSNLGIQFSEFTQRVSWSNPTWDLFIVVFLLVGTLIYGFSMGRDRIIMIMVAVYMALVAVTNLPYVPQFGAIVSLSNGFILKIGTFLGLFAILFFMLTRSALNHAIGGKGA